MPLFNSHSDLILIPTFLIYSSAKPVFVFKMPGESVQSEKSDSILMTTWRPTLMKTPPNQGEELMNAKKNVNELIKPLVPESNKACICSPTSHAGSFGWYHHLASGAQNSSCCSSVADSTAGKGEKSKLNSKSQGGHEPVLSRFGRGSSLKTHS